MTVTEFLHRELFRTVQRHSSPSLFVFVLFSFFSPLMTFLLFLVLALLLYTPVADQEAYNSLLYIRGNVEGLENSYNSNCSNIKMSNCIIQS